MRTACAPTSTSPGALFSQRALASLIEAGMARDRPTASSRAQRSAPGTRASRSGTCWRRLRRRDAADLDAVLDVDAYLDVPRSSPGSSASS